MHLRPRGLGVRPPRRVERLSLASARAAATTCVLGRVCGNDMPTRMHYDLRRRGYEGKWRMHGYEETRRWRLRAYK